MLLPYKVESTRRVVPWSNLVLVGMCCLVHIGILAEFIPLEVVQEMVLAGWSPLQLFGSMFLHTNLLHLAGNMFFLIVFGNAICSRIGNTRYVLVYVATGLVASAAHLIFDGRPAVGASGAIAGVFGICVVVLPLADVKVFYWLIYALVGTVKVPCAIVLIIYAIMDVLALVLGGGMVAHWAHVGGFVGGLTVGTIALVYHWLPEDADAGETIVDLVRGPQWKPRHRRNPQRKSGVPYSLADPGVVYPRADQVPARVRRQSSGHRKLKVRNGPISDRS